MFLLTLNGQPPFPCKELEETLTLIDRSVSQGFFHRDNGGNSIYITLGPGSVIALVSDETMREKKQEEVDAKRRAQGLIIPGRDKPEEDEWCMVVQFSSPSGEIMQLNPIPYATKEAADDAVKAALFHSEVIKQVVEEGHDYIWVTPGPTTSYMVLSREFMRQQQRAMAEMQRRLQAAQAQQTGQQLGGGPKIVLR